MQKLLDKYTDEEILKHLFKLYPDQRKSEEGYKSALSELRTTRPKKDPMLILVEKCYDKFDKKYYTHVIGVDPKDTKWTFAIELTLWSHWLGMEIHPKSLEKFKEIDILAHCLWEMTFCGYSNRQIRNDWRKLNKISDQVRKNMEKNEV